MAIILSLETATEVCSVALSENNDILADRTLIDGLKHSAFLTTLIEEVMIEAGLKLKSISAVALSNGPGSYTGLRVGASTAKGICFALDKPLIAVSTLEALGSDHRDAHQFIMPTLDARRMEAYTAVYHKGKLLRQVEGTIWTEKLVEELADTYHELIICGNGIEKARQLFAKYDHINIRPSTCSAKKLIPLASEKYDIGKFENIAYHSPFYFKTPNITKPKRKLLE